MTFDKRTLYAFNNAITQLVVDEESRIKKTMEPHEFTGLCHASSGINTLLNERPSLFKIIQVSKDADREYNIENFVTSFENINSMLDEVETSDTDTIATLKSHIDSLQTTMKQLMELEMTVGFELEDNE